MEERAYAKLNISLDVVSKMENGYHAVRLIMQSVSLFDAVEIEVFAGTGIRVQTNLFYLPSDDKNIAAKAAGKFFEHTGITGYGCTIKLDKKIPVCAGLGGGSSDAAAVLRALNRHFEAGLTRAELEKLGAEIGSDVPFCVAGGTSLAEGRGEILKDLSPMPECEIVICKPPFSISTPKLFAAIDCEKIKYRPDTQGIIAALDRGDLKEVSRRMYNVFEDVLGKRSRQIWSIKEKLMDHGALGACMSGTGPAVFGVFNDKDAAVEAFNSLKHDYRSCFMAKPVRSIYKS